MKLIFGGRGVYCELCGNGVTPKNNYDGIPLPYKIGEVVAVAQSYQDIRLGDDGNTAWTNKLFVKVKLMPHQIEMLDVRVERLQDITDENCFKEGIEADEDNYFFRYDPKRDFIFTSPIEVFAELIDKVSGEGIWESNPSVFRNEFKLK